MDYKLKMDTFPDVIRIKIIDIDTGSPIPKIVVKINIFAKYKNNYNFILPISDNHRIIEITKDWLNQEINKISSLFIMDYSSSLTDCEPKFEFRICSTEEVNRALKAQIFYKNSLDITQKFIEQLSLVDNFKYQPLTQMIELHGEKIIDTNEQAHGS
jgi:hypothetical protein